MPEMINKILIVDDQASFLNGMSRALKRYCDFPGDVKTVNNGRKAIDEVSSCFYDICFLDLNLPDINGLDVMEKINSISPKTKVVIMTADVLDDDMKMKVEKGASMYIPKPVELDDIRDFIHKESGTGGDSMVRANTGKETGADKGDPMGTERRQHARRPCNEIVRYSMSIFYNWETKSDLEARVVDISTEGACITANYPLYPGNVLKFDASLESRSGLVRWSKKDAENFRAGIRFL